MAMLHKAKHRWQRLDPSMATSLSDARLQLHHAAQLVAAMGISYLPHQADDSHTSMEWFAGALASQVVGPKPFRLAVRPNPFGLVIFVGDAPFALFNLNGRTIDEAAEWVKRRVGELGLDSSKYTLAKHYTIPDHPVARGARFDTTENFHFEELQGWFNDASVALFSIGDVVANTSPIRCWPHHFDIATLITMNDGKTIGLGMEPGDVYYDEPYWYANMSPAPSADLPRGELHGGGQWHTKEWLGAVLPGSHMVGDEAQQASIGEFVISAINACAKLLRATS